VRFKVAPSRTYRDGDLIPRVARDDHGTQLLPGIDRQASGGDDAVVEPEDLPRRETGLEEGDGHAADGVHLVIADAHGRVGAFAKLQKGNRIQALALLRRQLVRAENSLDHL
jgi:hypothetical protein